MSPPAIWREGLTYLYKHLNLNKMNTVNTNGKRIIEGFIQESMNKGEFSEFKTDFISKINEEIKEAQKREEESRRELEGEEADYNRFKKSMSIVAVLSFIFLMLFFSCSPSKSEGPIVEVSKEWEAQLERQDKYERKGTYNLERTVEDNRRIDSYKDVEYIVDLHLCAMAGFYEELYGLPDDSTPTDYTSSFSVDEDYDVADCFGVSRIYDIDLERGEISDRQYKFLKNQLGDKFRLVFITVGDGNYETYLYSEKYNNKPLFTISFSDYDRNVSFYMRDDITVGSFL